MVRSPHQEVFLEKTKQSDLRGSFEPQRQGTGLRVCDSDAVAVCIFSGDLRDTEVELPHLMFLLLIPLVKLGAGMGMGIWFRDFLNGGLLFGTLLVANILSGYHEEIRFIIFVVVILVLLKVFAVFYETYFGMKDMFVCFSRRSGEEKREEAQEDGLEFEKEGAGSAAGDGTEA